VENFEPSVPDKGWHVQQNGQKVKDPVKEFKQDVYCVYFSVFNARNLQLLLWKNRFDFLV
jgi:hypothetical protein